MRIAVAGATGLVGTRLCALARAEGHEVVELARSTGVDLLDPQSLQGNGRDLLAGVEAVVDVTQGPSQDEAQAVEFFRQVATNLGRAATAAGVRRTVVLSIVGVDVTPDYGYYVAKLAHEQATRAAAPGVSVLRATQFHEFAGQVLGWSTVAGVAHVLDVRSQPVELAEVVRLLLDHATGSAGGDVDLAGPQPESLVDQVRRLVAHIGSAVQVQPVPAPTSMANGSMLPGPRALLRGQSWQQWLEQQ